MIRREVQQRRDPRMKRLASSPAGSCWLRPRAACRRSTASTCALSGTPMLPPTSTCRPAASSIRPTSVVVVDLPLVPVMATMRPRSQRERELQLADHRDARRRAPRPSGSSSGTPGLITTRSARSNGLRLDARRARAHAVRSQPSPHPRSPASRRVSVTRAPRRTSSSAAATPLRAAPTTTTSLRDAEVMSMPSSPQLQRRQAEQREDDRDDHESRDDLRLLPSRSARSDGAAAPSGRPACRSA